MKEIINDKGNILVVYGYVGCILRIRFLSRKKGEQMTFNEFCQHHNVTDEERGQLINLLFSVKFNDRMRYLYTELLQMVKQLDELKKPFSEIIKEIQ